MRTLAVVFDDQEKSAAGARALRELHGRGSLTLYGLAVVAREPRGRGLSVREPLEEGGSAAAPTVGAAVGALVSLLGGPVTAGARTLESGLVGTVRDLVEAGLAADFLEQVSRRLRPGCAAILADVEEESPLPLEGSIASLGGRVLRQAKGAAAPEELMAREVMTLQEELAALRQEGKGREHAATAEAVRRARATELRRALRRARVLANALRREAAAKVVVLRQQAACLEGEARAAAEHRAGTVREGLAARAFRLDQLIEDLVWPAARGTGGRRIRRREGRDF